MAEQAAACDIDRYMAVATVPFVSRSDRARLLALILLHHEIARIPAIVGEAMPGLIRLAWWREQLHGEDKGLPAFLDVLRPEVTSGAFDPEPLLGCVERELATPDEMRESATLERSACLQRASAAILGVRDGEMLSGAAAVGEAHGIALKADHDAKQRVGRLAREIRSGPKPSRRALPAFTLLRVAEARADKGATQRLSLSLPLTIFAAALSGRY